MASHAKAAPAASNATIAASIPASTCLMAKLARQTTKATTATATSTKPGVLAVFFIVSPASGCVVR
jgi:hypothetical protein